MLYIVSISVLEDPVNQGIIVGFQIKFIHLQYCHMTVFELTNEIYQLTLTSGQCYLSNLFCVVIVQVGVV